MEQIKKFVRTERQKLDMGSLTSFLETFGQIVLLSFAASVILNTYILLH
jgi:hypothetical protein